MPKAPSFQWYPKDCDTDENVRAMDDREFGFYMRCLNHAWLNDGIPGDLSRLAVVMGRTRAYVAKLWPSIAPCFELVDGRFFNKKQEESRQDVRDFLQKRKSAAQTRWDKHNKAKDDSDAQALQVQCPPTAAAVGVAVGDANGDGEVKEGMRVAESSRYSPAKKPDGFAGVPVSGCEWPEFTAAIQKPFPSTDGQFILRIVQDSIQGAISDGIDPTLVTDHALAEAVRTSMMTDNVKRAGLLAKTVPQIIRNWGREDHG